MNTFTWAISSGGDWGTASDWSPAAVPDSSTAVVVIANTGTHTVTIAAGESQAVNGLTIGNTGFGGTAAKPTLEIAGTLQFAGTTSSASFLQGGLTVDPAGVVEGSGELGVASFGTFNFLNNGTLIGDGGTNPLFILSSFTNAGTVLAENGQVGIEGPSFSNFSGTTLTGGSYIVQGPAITAGTYVTDSQIELGYNYTADIVVDAANVVLSGASQLDGYANGGFQPLEQQLQTIAATGSLQLLDARGFLTSNALTDNGRLNLQGGSLGTGGLTVGNTGLFEGFGVVTGSVSDAGDIIANGGALYIPGAVSGTGTLGVDAGSALILAGATPAFVSNNGVIYDTAGLLTINALSGTGTLEVQNGGTLDLGVATNEAVVFSGSDATLILGAPLIYGGTLSGFALADSLVLHGITANAATIVGGDTLVVMESGTTVDTVVLGGNYTGAAFAVQMTGTNAVVTNTAGAPERDDMPVSISLSDTAGLTGTEESAIVNVLSAAAADWGQYITGHTTLRIQLNIVSGTTGSELANGGPGDFIATGQTLAGEAVNEASSIYALVTGNYDPNATADIVINLPATSTDLSQLYINPSPFTNPTATGSGYDLLSIFRHEMAHGLGFVGERNAATGALGGSATLFDLDTQLTINSGNTITAASFTGADAEATYGALLGTIATPVPLTLLNNGEAFSHVANASADPLGHDLMNGIGLLPETSVDISGVDLGILQDVGLPVTAGGVYASKTPSAADRTDTADLTGFGTSATLWRNTTSGAVVAWLMNKGTFISNIALLSDPNWNIAATGDFNDDGTSDLLWRNAATGTVVEWLMSNGTLSSSLELLADPNWIVAGTGDFNGDRTSDILWRDAANGEIIEWLMKSDAVSQAVTLPGSGTQYEIAGKGDFNGDGTSDILVRNNDTGALTEWQMHNGTVAATIALLTDPDSTVVGTGDFNGDGITDILIRNRLTGSVSEELMNSGGSIASSVVLLTDPSWTVVGTGDYNGEGTTDILWRNNSTGAVLEWDMQSGTLAANIGLLTDPSWTVTGTPMSYAGVTRAVTDLGGDGRSDIVWVNASSGAVVDWQMNGATINASAQIFASTAWSMAGVGDFNGDGNADLLWSNASTGAIALWQMNGASLESSATIFQGAGWSVAGTGDFNGDGNSDILLRNGTSGQVVEWEMAGSTLITAATLLVDPNWTVAGVGDFNGDGKSDILWDNASTGALLVWQMNGTQETFSYQFLQDRNWSVAGVGDFNGDGISDILLHNASTGVTMLWEMSGINSILSKSVLLADPSWSVAGVGDYNGDGKSDILWHNAASGATVMWEMNGSTILSAAGLLTSTAWMPASAALKEG